MKLQEIKKKVYYNDPFDRYFLLDAKVTKSSKGYNILGDATLKPEFKMKLKELPFKINEISGVLDLSSSFLTSLKNFPNKAGTINLSHCPRIHSLASPEPIEVSNSFKFEGSSIVNASGAQISAYSLEFDDCVFLKSLRGLSGNINFIYLFGCSNFEQDPYELLESIKGLEKVSFNLKSLKKVPLIKSILFTPMNDNVNARIRFALIGTTNGDKLEKIVNKYHMKGPSQIVNLMRELRDAGFEDHAKI